MPLPNRFWKGAGVVLLVGVPCALLARTHWRQPMAEAEHSHGGDPKFEAELTRTSGAERSALLRKTAQESLPARRLAVAELLAKEPGTDGLALAKELLKDNDSEVRLKAAYALAQAGAEPERPFLRACLHDSDLWLRQEIVQWAATQAGRPKSAVGSWLVPDLIACLDDPSEPLRAFATNALAKLNDKPWRYNTRLNSPSANAAVLASWKSWWHTQKQEKTAPEALPDIAPRRTDPVPTVSFQTIEGKTVAPATSGRVTLINFWGTWCPPCRQEIPDLEKLHVRYGPRGLDVVGIALSEKDGAAGLRAWCQKNGLTYPQSLAEDAVTEAYGDVHEVPISVLVDQQGRIRYRWQGERDYASFAAQVEKLL